jgi:hypothetical protein
MTESRTRAALVAIFAFALLATLPAVVSAGSSPAVGPEVAAVVQPGGGALSGVLAQATPTNTPNIPATQTQVALLQTATALAATQTALVPSSTPTSTPNATQTVVAATATAAARATQTAVAALTQVVGNPTPSPTVVLTPGVPSGACATAVGNVCTISSHPNNPSPTTMSGTWTKTGSGTYNVTATGPANTIPGSVPAIFLPTTIGVEGFFTTCTAVPAAAPFTTTCAGNTVGDVLQGGVIVVRFATTTGPFDVRGIAAGPGLLVPLPPPPPPAGLPPVVPQVAIPAVPRPPVQFIPSAPAPLLPPMSPVAPLQAGAAPARFPEIPVIPEADSVLLLLGGLAAVGALAAWRRRA